MRKLTVITASFLCLLLFTALLGYLALSDTGISHLLYGDKSINHEQCPHISKNVYIILVDGLRYDSVLKNMPELSSYIYNKNACLLKARFNGPSNSRPGYARVLTGTPTHINKIYKNNQQSICTIPSIFKISREYNLTTGASAYYWIGQLFNKEFRKDVLYDNKSESIQHYYFYSNENENDTKIIDMGISIIEKNRPNLMLIHTMETDMSGHKSGALSKAYVRSVLKTDLLIKKVLSKIDFNESTVIVLSDHGHRDRGGHGGNSIKEVEVPVIIIGNGIKRGIYDEIISQEDVAPTVCAILGLPPTPYMTGSVIDFPFSINIKHLIGTSNRLYDFNK